MRRCDCVRESRRWGEASRSVVWFDDEGERNGNTRASANLYPNAAVMMAYKKERKPTRRVVALQWRASVCRRA